jgi:glyoxylase I family protein
MTAVIQTGAAHHLALTVTNLHRSVEFYTTLMNFQPALDMGTRMLLHNGTLVLAVTLPPDPTQALPGDCFNENRVGLDHLSLSVGSKADLEQAVKLFDERGVPHGEIKDLGEGLRLYVLAFRDPDNIQIELSAPYA